MATSDPLEILLTHNEWATRQLIEACKALSAEQFQRTFEIGPGSLHHAVTHMIQAMRVWSDMLAGRERRPPLEPMGRTPEQLLAFFDEAAAELGSIARRHPLDEMVVPELLRSSIVVEESVAFPFYVMQFGVNVAGNLVVAPQLICEKLKAPAHIAIAF